MIDKTNPSHFSPEQKKDFADLIFDVIKLTRGIVQLILDHGPVATEKLYGMFTEKGLTTGTVDRIIVLCEASGKVKRDGLVFRPTTPKEELEHDKQMVETIIQLQKEIQARGL